MEKLKSIQIKGKDYVAVNERIRYFNENYSTGSITTEILSNENGVILMKATVIPDIATPERRFTGLAYEKESGSYINKTSYIENCETSAVGRALGFMGIGVDTSIATAEEVQNAINNQGKTTVSMPKATEKPTEPVDPVKEKSGVITTEEGKELVTLAKDNGYTQEELYSIIFTLGYTKVVDILKQDYQTLLDDFSVMAGDWRQKNKEIEKKNWDKS